MNERGRSLPNRRTSTTVYIDWDQLADLRRVSAETCVPMAALIRRGIDLMVAAYKSERRAEGIGSISPDADVQP